MSREARWAVVTFLAGAILMLGFDVTATRIVGVLALMGGIVLGAFAIATPGFTREDD